MLCIENLQRDLTMKSKDLVANIRLQVNNHSKIIERIDLKDHHNEISYVVTMPLDHSNLNRITNNLEKFLDASEIHSILELLTRNKQDDAKTKTVYKKVANNLWCTVG